MTPANLCMSRAGWRIGGAERIGDPEARDVSKLFNPGFLRENGLPVPAWVA